MLLNSVVIVLREVLEAALMLSVLLASERFLHVNRRWVLPALLLGLAGAATYGHFLGSISELFDGVGQEVCNALLQLATFVLIAVLAFQIPQQLRSAPRPTSNRIALLMAAMVIMAFIREGSEIYIYVSGFWNVTNFFSAVALGSIVGGCIGFSIGVLIYYLLLARPPRQEPIISISLLALIGAGLSSQAVRLLIQADWISAGSAIWDTSSILSEQSLLGQLAYALVGYEASPAAVEVIVYLGSLSVVALAYFAGKFASTLIAEATP
jgi:high-affinity iron transporter